MTPMTNGSAIMTVRKVRSAPSTAVYRRTSVPSWAVRLRDRGGGATTRDPECGSSGWAEASVTYLRCCGEWE